MSPKLVQDFFHVESGREGLDKNSRADRAGGDAEVGLGEVENVGPETRFEIVLHLREIKVRPGAVGEEVGGIMEKVETKVEDGTRDGPVVDGDSDFIEMPSAGTINS
jgi:hypothetical protein